MKLFPMYPSSEVGQTDHVCGVLVVLWLCAEFIQAE